MSGPVTLSPCWVSLILLSCFPVPCVALILNKISSTDLPVCCIWLGLIRASGTAKLTKLVNVRAQQSRTPCLRPALSRASCPWVGASFVLRSDVSSFCFCKHLITTSQTRVPASAIEFSPELGNSHWNSLIRALQVEENCVLLVYILVVHQATEQSRNSLIKQLFVSAFVLSSFSPCFYFLLLIFFFFFLHVIRPSSPFLVVFYSELPWLSRYLSVSSCLLSLILTLESFCTPVICICLRPQLCHLSGNFKLLFIFTWEITSSVIFFKQCVLIFRSVSFRDLHPKCFLSTKKYW